jgi:CO/xanthine dehydrogenase Mo-binding subunit
VTAAGSRGQEPHGHGHVRRKGGDLILTGHGGYLADVSLEGMRHAAILRSPHPHALIRSVDGTRAARCHGVRVVLTGQEAAGMITAIPHFFDPALVGGQTHEFRCLAASGSAARYRADEQTPSKHGDRYAAVLADGCGPDCCLLREFQG